MAPGLSTIRKELKCRARMAAPVSIPHAGKIRQRTGSGNIFGSSKKHRGESHPVTGEIGQHLPVSQSRTGHPCPVLRSQKWTVR
jgi:hypothetical protein